tara:strand:- start:95 stop:1021 length:927 start_codon:yes stop_codon:yes gene_type:complete
MNFAKGFKTPMGGPIEDQEGLDAIKEEGIKKGREDAKNASIKNTVNALSSGTGPMKTGGFGSNFSLGAGPAGSFAESRIASMKSNVSKARGGTGISNQYSKAEQRWKDAGGVEISRTGHSYVKDGVSDQFDVYSQKDGSPGDGYTMTKSELKNFKKDGQLMVQGSGAIPKAKNGVSIHKDTGGNIIENIEGTYGKTRDRAIIYRPTTSTQKQNVGREVKIREAKQLSSATPSLRTENLDVDIKKQVKQADKIAKKENRKKKKADKLADNSFKSYKKEYKAKKNKPAGVSGYGKVKNARQYAKAMMKKK